MAEVKRRKTIVGKTDLQLRRLVATERNISKKLRKKLAEAEQEAKDASRDAKAALVTLNSYKQQVSDIIKKLDQLEK